MTQNETTKQGQQQTVGSDTFTSIKDALSKSVSLKCSFTDEQGRVTESFVKNGAVRTNYTAQDPQDSGSMIMKDNKMYAWNAKNEGWMMEIQPEMKDTVTAEAKQMNDRSKGTASWDETMAAMEKYKESCKTAVVDDTMFTPPSTVTFQDYSKMMNEMMKAMPTGNSADDVQKMMQQYQSEPNPGN